MLTYGIVVPSLLLVATFVLEYVAFLTSHMIDSRSLASLHVGIFLRCSYPITIGHRNEFRCLWWSDDTFNHDESKNGFILRPPIWESRINHFENTKHKRHAFSALSMGYDLSLPHSSDHIHVFHAHSRWLKCAHSNSRLLLHKPTK